MRIGIAGAGAVGRRVSRQIVSMSLENRVVFFQPKREGSRRAAESMGGQAAAGPSKPALGDALDAMVLCGPRGTHAAMAKRCLELGLPCISTADSIEDVQAMMDLDHAARSVGVPMLVGAGFMPGLTCILASYFAPTFDQVDEIHVAKHGTGGPACARAHHRALKNPALDRRDGAWVRRPGGSGRELVWFPEPVSGADCYRAALPDAVLLGQAFPDAQRVTARMAATRQDRFTAWLPMLSPPHAEGAVGAVRLEVRGLKAGSHRVAIAGSAERPAVATGAVAAVCLDRLLANDVGGPGVRGLAELKDAGDLLQRLSKRGLRVQEFQGFDPTV